MHNINVSIVYALSKHQYLREMRVARGTNALDLLQQSGLLEEIEELRNINVDELQLGVFAQKITSDYLLEEGDRVEIYRQLEADPKEVRRQLALLGKTIGGSKEAAQEVASQPCGSAEK